MTKNLQTETFETKQGDQIEMSGSEIARWCCLIEAVDIIDRKGSQMGVDMKNASWVKPIAIQKYIDERYDTMVEEIERDQANYKLNI